MVLEGYRVLKIRIFRFHHRPFRNRPFRPSPSPSFCFPLSFSVASVLLRSFFEDLAWRPGRRGAGPDRDVEQRGAARANSRGDGCLAQKSTKGSTGESKEKHVRNAQKASFCSILLFLATVDKCRWRQSAATWGVSCDRETGRWGVLAKRIDAKKGMAAPAKWWEIRSTCIFQLCNTSLGNSGYSMGILGTGEANDWPPSFQYITWSHGHLFCSLTNCP